MEAVFTIILGIGLSALVALIGKNRKIGYGWTFVISLFLSPIIGIIVALCSDKNEVEFVEAENEKQ